LDISKFSFGNRVREHYTDNKILGSQIIKEKWMWTPLILINKLSDYGGCAWMGVVLGWGGNRTGEVLGRGGGGVWRSWSPSGFILVKKIDE